ncbi:XRE family transcriptional regulator [Capnocytophaga cynodegmi]|uniref:XRE family transcriptional regulator n=1 Tax=Capnocytophaga cynodegmi TaxID=28189 RepID=UPI00385B46E8
MKNNDNTEQSSVKDRLVSFLAYKKLSQRKFEEEVGLSNGYVNNMRKGIKPETFDEKIAPIFPELDKIWLLHGEGNMLNTSEPEEDFEDEENFLKTEREKYKMSLADISEKTNIPLKKLKEYDTGQKNIPKKTLEILEQFFEQVSNEYESYEQEDTSIPILRTEEVISSVQVPYYDVDFAGGWTSAELFSQQKPLFIISSPDFARAEFACNLIGNSISNRIENGSIIGLRKVDEWQIYFPTNEIYGIVTKNGLRTVKIVKRSKEKGFLELIPDALPQFNNPPYEHELIPIDYIVEFYQVTAWAYFERLAM